jgi:hypothetical protein
LLRVFGATHQKFLMVNISNPPSTRNCNTIRSLIDIKSIVLN